MTANDTTLVTYVGIAGRKRAVPGRVIHPPQVGEHIRWMTFSRRTFDFRFTYYEVIQVQWDVRDRYHYLYRPGEEGEGYLTVFLKRASGSPGEAFDRAERAADRAKQRRRQKNIHPASPPE